MGILSTDAYARLGHRFHSHAASDVVELHERGVRGEEGEELRDVELRRLLLALVPALLGLPEGTRQYAGGDGNRTDVYVKILDCSVQKMGLLFIAISQRNGNWNSANPSELCHVSQIKPIIGLGRVCNNALLSIARTTDSKSSLTPRTALKSPRR
jgi:hypothetical protein